MKRLKLILIVILSSLCICLCACTTQTIPNEGSVTLSLPESFKEYIKYDDIPSFTLNFDGTLNTVKNVNKSYYTVFSSNDDIILSNAIKSLLETSDDVIYEVENTDKTKTRYFSKLENGKVKNESYQVDDETVYDEIAYIKLDNGLTMTIDYCRFNSNGETYYTWRYSQSVSFYVYYPLMRINNGENKEIVLLTLPNMVSLHVGPDLKVSSLINKDAYLESSYYTFSYYEKEDEGFDKKGYVKNYYQSYNLESIDESSFYFSYLNNKFKLTLNETNFVIEWIERI